MKQFVQGHSSAIVLHCNFSKLKTVQLNIPSRIVLSNHEMKMCYYNFPQMYKHFSRRMKRYGNRKQKYSDSLERVYPPEVGTWRVQEYRMYLSVRG
jgi:hypothetical protein